MGASLYICKVICRRHRCKIPENMRGEEAQINRLREWMNQSPAFNALAQRVGSVSTAKSADNGDLYEDIRHAVTYHDPASGVVDLVVQEWARQYLEDEPCTPSDSPHDQFIAHAFEAADRVCRLVDASRIAPLSGPQGIELIELMAEITALPSKAFLRRPIELGKGKHWIKPERPRELGYMRLLSNAYAMCIEEILASAEIADETERLDRGYHHIALATDIVSNIWNAYEIYSDEALSAEI